MVDAEYKKPDFLLQHRRQICKGTPLSGFRRATGELFISEKTIFCQGGFLKISRSSMAGIYIHIPFCKQACHYCDFHFSTSQESRSELVQSILKEIKIQKDYLRDEAIQTIYFGGGTPSVLEAHELSIILESVRSSHRVVDDAEVTLEANPDDLTLLKLNEFSSLGINRLSIGIQSFHSEMLTFLNRVHDANTAIKSFHQAREAGFKNISIDLIYALPDESETQWRHDINQAIALQPDHLSCYALTIEEKTVFGRWSAAGKLKPADDETAAQHLEILMDEDRKSTRLNSSHSQISYAVFCLKKKKKHKKTKQQRRCK